MIHPRGRTHSCSPVLAGYRPVSGRYDELLDARGNVRAHWQALMEGLMSADSRLSTQRCLQLTRRLIADNGVTYNVYADSQGADRPWTLDPLPLILTAKEWSDIERGIAQRARLLNALLTDLYGAQRLLAEGLVPPQIPFGHPSFLWPCHGIVPRQSIWVRLYAADLARAPDGRWCLVADRTQAPSGAGYALENRQIMEQVLPQAIRELGVRRVRDYFAAVREQLLIGRDGEEGGLAVILTPGPLNETYFEQSFLAHQLGWPLVEGADLTVRRDTVFLKTLAGLRRVHTIIRRVDDDWCDPLELRSDSALGVPGLLGALRAGRVTLANALGSGVLESSAWLGFMPTIAERLLGEPLQLPSLPAWWCGERAALEHVVHHLQDLVIWPTYPNQRLAPQPGAALGSQARAELIARLRAQPHAYVAREPLVLSQAPSLHTEDTSVIEARPLSLRVYALVGAQGCAVLPGGLARVAAVGNPDVVSHQRGGGSKDIWVLPPAITAETPDAPVSPVATLFRHEELPSRLVENLYWFGRYSARCENKARLLRATFLSRIDAEVHETAAEICRKLDASEAQVDADALLPEDPTLHGIIADARRLAWCASQIRSRLSATYWGTLTELQRQLHDTEHLRADPRNALEGLLRSLAAFAGLTLDDMRQDRGWRLLCIGRRIERLQFGAHLLSLHLEGALATEQSHVEWLLAACDCLRIYRPRYALAPRLGPMLDLLLRDTEHPRSLSFQWQGLRRDLAALGAEHASDLQRCHEPLPSLSDADLVTLEGPGARPRQALANSLRSHCATLHVLSDQLSMHYFSHTRLDSHALAS